MIKSSSLAAAPTAENIAADIQTALAESWLPRLYRERILTQRTRAYTLPATSKKPSRKNVPIEIQHTLLGVELKIGRHRLMCPDLATARYLAVFARLNIPSIAVPYDISRISHLADELDSAWHRMLLLIEKETRGRTRTVQTRVRNRLIERATHEIAEAGAGASFPQFAQTTKQRKKQ